MPGNPEDPVDPDDHEEGSVGSEDSFGSLDNNDQDIGMATFKTSAVQVPAYYGDAFTEDTRSGIHDWIYQIEAIRDATLALPEAQRWTDATTANQAKMALKGEALNFINHCAKGASQYDVNVNSWESVKEALKENFAVRGTAKEISQLNAMAKQGYKDPQETVRAFMQRCYEIAVVKYDLQQARLVPQGLNAQQRAALRKAAIDSDVSTLFSGGLKQDIKDHMNVRTEDTSNKALSDLACMAEAGLREKNPGRNPWIKNHSVAKVEEQQEEKEDDKKEAPKEEEQVEAIRGNFRGRGRGRGGRGGNASQRHHNFAYNARGGGNGGNTRGRGRGGFNTFSTPFNGTCNNCKGWGHTYKFCPTPPQQQQQQRANAVEQGQEQAQDQPNYADQGPSGWTYSVNY